MRPASLEKEANTVMCLACSTLPIARIDKLSGPEKKHCDVYKVGGWMELCSSFVSMERFEGAGFLSKLSTIEIVRAKKI